MVHITILLYLQPSKTKRRRQNFTFIGAGPFDCFWNISFPFFLILLIVFISSSGSGWSILSNPFNALKRDDWRVGTIDDVNDIFEASANEDSLCIFNLVSNWKFTWSPRGPYWFSSDRDELKIPSSLPQSFEFRI